MLILAVGFSRLYNGVHSMDQIIYAYLLGTWLAITLHFGFKKLITDHIDQLLKDPSKYTP